MLLAGMALVLAGIALMVIALVGYGLWALVRHEQAKHGQGFTGI